MGDKERKNWLFWVLDNREMPVQARGYECPPNDDVYWFPDLRFSTSAVYQSEEKAVERAIAIATADKQNAESRLEQLRSRRKGAGG